MSLTQLEARVHLLEGRGVRAERHSVELAGLAQALTEEQRAVILRLDGIEESLRGARLRGPLASGEDRQVRLGRLEREQRSAALSLRLIVSASEEAEKRHSGRMQALEEEQLGLRKQAPRGDVARTALLARDSSAASRSAGSCGSLAKTRPGLEGAGAAPDASVESPKASVDEVWGTRLGEVCAEMQAVRVQVGSSHREMQSAHERLAQELASRLDAAAALWGRSPAAAEEAGAVAELQRQVQHLLSEAEAHREADAAARERERRERATSCEPRGAGSDPVGLRQDVDKSSHRAHADAARKARERGGRLAPEQDAGRVEADAVAELRGAFEGQLARSERRVGELDAALGRLRSRMDGLCAGAEEGKADAEKMRSLCDRVNHLISSSEAQKVEAEEATTTARDTANQARACCDAREHESRGAMSCLSRRVDELTQLRDAHRASAADTVGRLSDRAERLPTPDEPAELRGSVEEHSASMAEPCVSVSSASDRGQDLAQLRRDLEAQQGQADDAWAGGKDLAADVRDLQGRCAALQEAVEERLSVSVWRIDRQLPEALEKVEWLASENADWHARLQEHDVRLGLALSRLDLQEQRVQALSDRLEVFPGLAQLRGMWQDELRRRLEEADVRGLGQTVASQAEAIEELTEAVQALCDRLALHGEFPVAAPQPF